MISWVLPMVTAAALAVFPSTVTFDQPIDALSVTMSSVTTRAEVRGWDGTAWTAWFPLTVEEEFDPLLRESNLVIFPLAVEKIELRPRAMLRRAQHDIIALHPLRIAKNPTHTFIASRLPLPARRILSRKEWGAEDAFLFQGDPTERSDVAPDQAIAAVENGNGVVPERLRECEDWQRQYPEEFRPARTVREDGAGRKYRWPLQYSRDVKLLVVHHTAQNVAGDERPPLERVRALYAYHANSRGWGDVGYHYLIDERGQIYEGRAGGRGTIGGHAYCWNTGTVSIAMLGNFDVEQPPQAQMQGLQWLLADIARQEGIDLGSSVRMHGKNFPPIVGHKDLLSTDCPGYYVRETLSQVRENVWKGNVFATIRFPRPILSRRTTLPPAASPTSALVPRTYEPLLAPIGMTQLQGRPGMLLPFSITYRGGASPTAQYATIADIAADRGIFLWQERGKRFIPVRGTLRLPSSLPARESTSLRLKIQFPMEPGTHSLTIGPVRYTLIVAGKRARSADSRFQIPDSRKIPIPKQPMSQSTNQPLRNEQRANSPTSNDRRIRIRLTFSDDTVVVLVPEGTTVNGNATDSREVLLAERDGQCAAEVQGKRVAIGTVRLVSAGPVAFADKEGTLHRYGGTLECRFFAGNLVLINELPLEDYLLGLAEEPDTEPHEKQKAFAIAARSYAAHYMNPTRRKFPDMPYDGSDDPAVFQAYAGLTFAERNPNWVRAVRETAGQVLTKDGDILRAAYFSNDAGQTRSPEEAGWTDFPHAEVFGSKPDPWCAGHPNAGHGVGMSGCGARGQAEEGKRAEEILQYYYPGAVVTEVLSISLIDE